MKATATREKKEKKKQPTVVSGPTPKQRSILESLGIVSVSATAAARPPTHPKSPPLVDGKQRSLDGLAKVVRKNKDEKPSDVLARCVGTLRGYQRAFGGGGGGGDEEERGGDEGAARAAGTSTSAASASTTSTEDQARSALRELSCVRVESALIAATGAGSALREFRKDPRVAVALSVQAEKILVAWREAVTSEVRAGRRYRAHTAAASAASAVGGGGVAAAASEGKATATPRGRK